MFGLQQAWAPNILLQRIEVNPSQSGKFFSKWMFPMPDLHCATIFSDHGQNSHLKMDGVISIWMSAENGEGPPHMVIHSQMYKYSAIQGNFSRRFLYACTRESHSSQYGQPFQTRIMTNPACNSVQVYAPPLWLEF